MNRRNKREIKRIEKKLTTFVKSFYEICYFDEKKLDWNIISEQEFKRLNREWIYFCNKKNYTDEIAGAFKLECMILKTDLIGQVKFDKEFDKSEIVKLLKEGKRPIEVVDYLEEKYNEKMKI